MQCRAYQGSASIVVRAQAQKFFGCFFQKGTSFLTLANCLRLPYPPDPMTDADPDAEARRSLRRHRIFATLLLIIMAALTLGSYYLPRSYWTDQIGRAHV